MADKFEFDLSTLEGILEHGRNPVSRCAHRCVPEITIGSGAFSAICAKYFSRINDIVGPHDFDSAFVALE